jgi:type I restriction enzyme M protein
MAPGIYKDYAPIMFFLKYISDVYKEYSDGYREESGDSPELIPPTQGGDIFVVPDLVSFDALYKERKEPGNEERIDAALKAIEGANATKLEGVFDGVRFNANRLGPQEQADESLRFILEGFYRDELDLRPSRIVDTVIIANAFNSILTTTMGHLGMYYETHELSTLMAQLVGPQEGDEIADPACGSASLLLKCSAEIQNQFNGSKEFSLYGQDLSINTLALAKINLLLHGINSYQLEQGDTIRHPKLIDGENKLKKFDVVISVPPLGVSNWWREMETPDVYGRFDRGLPPRAVSDYAFILNII